jgi:hypothetical protein
MFSEHDEPAISGNKIRFKGFYAYVWIRLWCIPGQHRIPQYTRDEEFQERKIVMKGNASVYSLKNQKFL